MNYCIQKPFELAIIPCGKVVYKELTTDAIIGTVCEHYGLSKRSLTGNSKLSHQVNARFVAMHLIRIMLPKIKTVAIGKLFNRHHTSVVYASGVVTDRLRIERVYRNQFNMVYGELRNLNNGERIINYKSQPTHA